ncbi:DUF2255 family protein [Herbidospora cretacea]|uniref:DUF2255 family protein n=1 Tax=Herbidospora cretacea TaxID=28444 RepID=UPI0007736BC2|nr:DUF2255 family protein [Herbidospora cretacea]
MATWTNDELVAIGEAAELEIAPRLVDGTLIKPVTIWVVRHNDDLFVRSYRGEDSHWFTVSQIAGEGQITAGGVRKEVRFVREHDSPTNDAVDLAYRMKYRDQDTAYVDPLVASPAKETTLKLVPR